MNTRSPQPKRSAAVSTLVSTLALIALLATPATAQETTGELGRLFFTPERRQVLDRQRQHHIQEQPDASEDATLTINGVVTRSSGKRTVWINGVSQNEKEPRSDVTVTPIRKEPGKVVVKANDVPAIRAKVGDTVIRNTGESSSALDGGRITILRPLAAPPQSAQ